MKFLFILLVQVIFAGYDDIWVAPEDKSSEIWHESTKGQGLQKFPGLKVRLAQGVTDMIRQNLLEYGAAYLNYDY